MDAETAMQAAAVEAQEDAVFDGGPVGVVRAAVGAHLDGREDVGGENRTVASAQVKTDDRDARGGVARAGLA